MAIFETGVNTNRDSMDKLNYGKAYINASVKECKKKIDRILPSPFFHEPEFKDIEILKDDIKRMKVFRGFYVKSGYTQISFNCLNIIDKLADNPNLIRLINYIAANIEYDSNKIVLSSSDEGIIRIIKAGNNLSRYINKLEEYNIIARTNKRSVYVVNHNMIFKGTYTTFVDDYMKIYPNADIVIDDDKKVIIK